MIESGFKKKLLNLIGDNQIKINLSFIVLIGFILRLRGLTEGNFWADELLRLSWYKSDFEVAVHGSGHVNIGKFFLWILYFLIPNDIFWIRFPLVLISTATIIITYLICTKIINPTMGIYASLIIAMSPLSIRYSTEVSLYPFLEFFTALGIFCTIYHIDKNDKISYFFLILSLLILSSSPLTFGIVMSTILYLWIRKIDTRKTNLKTRLEIIILNKYFRDLLWPIVLCLYLSYTTILNGQVNSSGQPLNYQYFIQIIGFWNDEAISFLNIIIPLVTVIFPLVIFKSLKEEKYDFIFIYMCLITSMAILAAPSLFSEASVQGRYLIQLCPIFAIIISISLEEITKFFSSLTGRIEGINLMNKIVTTCIVLFMLSSSLTIIKEAQLKPEYVEVIEDMSSPEQKLIFSTPDNIYWETTAIINEEKILEISYSSWSFDDLQMQDCSMSQENKKTYLLVAEQHNDISKIEDELSQNWEIINFSHYYHASWYEISPLESWRNNCFG